MNKIPQIAANIIKERAKQQHFIPGIFLAIHTFGRKINRNFHLHLSTTIGGLSLDQQSWVDKGYFHHASIKKDWRRQVIQLFRQEFDAGRLKLPKKLAFIKTYIDFKEWTGKLFKTNWVVHLQKPSNNMKKNVEYLGKYLKRPPLGEARLLSYDGRVVKFQYLDHYTNKNKIESLPVLDFIGRLISHIPDRYFRLIRYYGFLANRVVGDLLPKVKELIENKEKHSFQKPRKAIEQIKIIWRTMIQNFTGKDPLTCKRCKKEMIITATVFKGKNIRSFHKQLAMGTYPLRC